MTTVHTNPSRVILTYGRFDFFHQGHIRFLRQLAQLGDELVVGCTSDALAQTLDLPCAMTFTQRRTLLERCRYVSRVVAETDLAQKRSDIINYNAAVLAMGAEHEGQFEDLQDIAQVMYLPREATLPQRQMAAAHWQKRA